jgi:hypothetical protein
MFWPNVGRKYLECFAQVASTSDAKVILPNRTASVTPIAQRLAVQLMQAGQ